MANKYLQHLHAHWKWSMCVPNRNITTNSRWLSSSLRFLNCGEKMFFEEEITHKFNVEHIEVWQNDADDDDDEPMLDHGASTIFGRVLTTIGVSMSGANSIKIISGFWLFVPLFLLLLWYLLSVYFTQQHFIWLCEWLSKLFCTRNICLLLQIPRKYIHSELFVVVAVVVLVALAIK